MSASYDSMSGGGHWCMVVDFYFRENCFVALRCVAATESISFLFFYQNVRQCYDSTLTEARVVCSETSLHTYFKFLVVLTSHSLPYIFHSLNSSSSLKTSFKSTAGNSNFTEPVRLWSRNRNNKIIIAIKLHRNLSYVKIRLEDTYYGVSK
jgi:hypothetical protein